MTVWSAAVWVTGITFAFLALGTTAVALRESASRDVFAQFICQLAAYSLGLFLILRTYAPETSIRQFLALRKTTPALYPVALLLGISTALPANVLFEATHQIFPQLDAPTDLATLFFEASGSQRAFIAVAVVLAGPIIEEVLFRGGLFGPMLRAHRPAMVITGTAGYFALVHLDPHAMVPILLVGALLGYVRWAGGSLYPAVLAHMGFNAVPLASLLLGERPEPPGGSFDVPVVPTVVSTVVAIVLVLAVRRLSRANAARVARSRDLA